MFVSDLSAVRFNINLVWRDGMYFIVNFWIVKLLTIPRTLENDRIKLRIEQLSTKRSKSET